MTQGEDAALLHFIDTILIGEQPDKVAIAVSGGGDSMALLHLYMRWSEQTGVPVIAATVDHGLRAAAADEAAFVGAFCEEHQIPHSILNWDGTKATGNVQAAARDARYQLLSDWAWDNGTETIALGHTANDVAETFLMRLGRKAGLDGLAAMPPVFSLHRSIFVRPLWQQTREELRNYLRRHDVSWVDDPSNEDLTQTRPKARQILAALEPLGIDIESLKSTAAALASAKSAIQGYTCEEARRLVIVDRGDVLIQSRPRPPVHPDVERRLRLAAVRYINGNGYAPRESALINLDVALTKQDRHTVGGCIVSKEEGALRFAREVKATEPTIEWRNRTLGLLWDARWLVSEESETPNMGELTVGALGEHIKDVPDWRETGLPRASLMASPAVFEGETLISAPVAGLNNGFIARIVADFTSLLLSR
nr:tRNA lysidine(34) synthetase TilS [Octadecabacter sp. B2R22]